MGGMSPNRFLLAATLACAAAAVTATPTIIPDNFSCPSGWFRFAYKCYKQSAAQLSWQSARDECLLSGGDLMVVESVAELGFIKEMSWANSPTAFHIGLQKDPKNDQPVWVDGTLDKQRIGWYASSPQMTAINRCFYLQLPATTGGGFYYYDEPCSSEKYGVCQVEAEAVALAVPYEAASARVQGISPGIYNLSTLGSRLQCTSACNSISTSFSYGAVVDSACLCFSKETDATRCSANPTSCTSEPVRIFPTHKFLQHQLNMSSLTNVCPTGGSYYEGSCYILQMTTSNWVGQRSECQKIGADLAVIHSAEEYSFIADVLLRDGNGNYRFDVSPWIGLQDSGSGLLWADNMPAASSFTALLSTQSSTPSPPYCVYMGNYVWKKDGCDNPRQAVCKSTAAVTTYQLYNFPQSKLGKSYKLFTYMESTVSSTGTGYYTLNSFAYSGSNLAYGITDVPKMKPMESSSTFLLQPGLIEVNVESNSFYLFDRTTKSFLATATMDLIDTRIRCPKYALQFYTIQCDLEVISGSALVNIDFADGVRKSNFTLSGSQVYTVGPSFKPPTTQTVVSSPITVFLATSGFNYHGKIYALEFDAATKGAITFKIWRPSCTNGAAYCHKAVACILNTTDCATQTMPKISVCPPSKNIVSSAKRSCIDRANGESYPVTGVQLPIDSFSMAASITYNIPQRGYQILSFTDADAIEVFPGDYLGYSSSAAGATLNAYDKGFPVNDWTNYTFLRTTTETDITFNQKQGAAGVSAGSFDVFLRAHVARYVQVKIKQTYTKVGVFDVQASVYSQLSTSRLNVTTPIQVDTEINNVTIASMYYGVAVNYNTTFAVDEHPGTSVTYFWDFNDTHRYQTVNKTGILHVFTSGGVLNVTVTATNPLSQGSSWVMLYAQQEILNATARSRQNVTLLHSPTIFEASISAGTNVTWLFETQDEGIFYVDNLTNNAQVILRNHTYSAWGNYTMTITIWNLISNYTFYLMHHIQEAITGLKILPSKPIGYGRNVTFNMTMINGTDVTYWSTLDGNQTRDMTMDWRTRTGEIHLMLNDYKRTGLHVLNITGVNLLGSLSDGTEFWIDYIITNVTMVANTTYLRSFTDPCLFNITMDYGSRLQLNISYGDGYGSNFYYWPTDMLSTNVVQFTYTYPWAGHYVAILVATNAINQEIVQQNITVQNPVFGMNITTNSPQALYPDSVATTRFFLGFMSTNNGGLPFRIPSEAFQLYDFGDHDCPGAARHATTMQATLSFPSTIDSNVTTNVLLSTSNESLPLTTFTVPPPTTVYVPLMRPTEAVPDYANCTAATRFATVNVSEEWLDISEWDYTQFGTYTVTLNVSNFVSYMFWNFTIDIDQPVLNLIITADHYIVEWNTTVDLTAAMTWGSRINLTWDWMDGHDTLATRYDPYNVNTVTHVYDIVGVFFSQVMAENLVSTEVASLPTPIIVQYKVQHFVILGPGISLIKPPSLVEFVKFTLVVEKPFNISTNASYIIDFGDGTITNTSYLEGQRNATQDSSTYYHALSFEHGYLFGGDYRVCITLWNLVNNGSYCYNHTVYDTIFGSRDKAYYLGFNNSQNIGFDGASLQPNFFPVETELLFVSNITRGSHVYYTWDFGDNHTETYHQIEWVKHKYDQPGLYYVTLNASNYLTWDTFTGIVIMQRTIANVSISCDSPFPRNDTLTFQVNVGTIGTDACYFVDFRDVQSVGSQYFFFGNRTTCQEYYSKEMSVGDLRFEGYTTRDLEVTRETTNSTNVTISNEFMSIGVYYVKLEVVNRVSFASAKWRTGITRGPCRWPVVKLADSNACNNPEYCINGTKAVKKSERLFVNSLVNINCSSTAIAMYIWTIERSTDGTPDGVFELYNDTDVSLQSTNLRSLIIPPLVLPYGLYRFTLNVSMVGEIEIFSTDSVNLYIVRSPMVTGIVGGIKIRKQWGKNYTFDAATASYDPDNPTNKSGFSFKWLCRRMCQDFPTYDPTYSFVISPPENNNCTTTASINSAPVYNPDGCFKEDGYDGPGFFTNSTSGNVTVDLSKAIERDQIEILVIVFFVGKVTVVSQYMDVTLGEPPTLIPQCVTNCKEKLNAKSRLSIETRAEGSFGIPMVWSWRLWYGPAGSSSIIGIKNVTGDWTKFVSTGVTNPSIALEPGFFKESDNKYRFFLQVSAYRVSSTPENYGTSYYSFELNQPPAAGECYVEPENGTALVTTFNIKCISSFNTTALPIIYEIGYRPDENANYMWIGKGFKPELESPRTLPAGLESRNYTLDVVVRATDAIGGVTDLLITAEVRPAPSDSLDDMLQQLTSSGGPASTLQNVVSSGDAAAVASVFGALANTMNEVSTTYQAKIEDTLASYNASVYNITAEKESMTAEMLATKALYAKGRERMMSNMVSLAINDVSALRQLASASSSILAQQDEVTPDATRHAQTILMKGLNMIELQDKETSMPADQMESAVAACLGAAGALMDATAYLKSVSAVGSDADSVQSEILNSLSTMAVNIQSKKVAGEYPTVLKTEKMAISLKKAYLEGFAKGTLSGEGGNTLQLPSASGMFGEGNITFTYLQSQVTMMKSNPFLPSTANDSSEGGNSSMAVSSNVLRLTITDDSGSALNATKSTDPMHLFISRDTSSLNLKTNYEQPASPGSPFVVHKFAVSKMSSAFITLQHFINESLEEDAAATESTTLPPTSDGLNVTDGSSGTTNGSLEAQGPAYSFTLYIGIDHRPTEKKYDYLCKLPIKTGVENGSTVVTEGGLESSPQCAEEGCTYYYLKQQSLYPTAGPAGIDPHTCQIPEILTNKTEDFFIYVGVTYVVKDVNVTNNDTGTITRRKRDVGGPTASSANSSINGTATALVDPRVFYSMQVFGAKCSYWNPHLNSWSSDGCQVGPLTKLNSTHCICENLNPPEPQLNSTVNSSTSAPTRAARSATSSSESPGIAFGAGISLPMNTINLSDSAFNHLDENPLVFSVLVSMMCLYICALIWARRKDLDDAIKAGASPMLDNNPYDMYLYELTVYTGGRSRAGTTAKVSMILAGDEDETPPRLIYDDKRPVLQRGGVDSFVMAVPRSLGSLSHIRVWHDNGGKKPSWFFSRLQVVDMQTQNKFYFILDRWLAVDEDDGIIDRLVPLAGKDEMTGFNHLFWAKTKKDMFDGHLWFSIVGRPHKSRFTRCQRLTCCMSLVFSCMLVNIMFYKTSGKTAPTDGFSIGPVVITLPMILKGIASSLISMPVNFAILFIFKKAKPKPMKKKGLARNDLANFEKNIVSAQEGSSGEFESEHHAGNDGSGKVDKIKADKDAKKKKGKLKFPWWTIFIAYFLSLATCAVSFAFIVEFAGSFGPEKAQQWLCSFMISIVESVFLSQPLKVVLIALFFAMVIKKPANDEDADNALDKGDEYLHNHVTSSEIKSEAVRETLSKFKDIPLPPSDEYIKAAKEKRAKENKMMDIIKEIIFYLAFLYLMAMAAYGNADPWNNITYRNLRATLQAGLYNQTNFWESPGMDNVKTSKNFLLWTKQTFLPALYGDKAIFPEFGVDRNTILAVNPRLRQLRVASGKCRMPVYKYEKVCKAPYDRQLEETGAYKAKWIPVNESISETGDSGWIWQSDKDLEGHSYDGTLAQYGGGGYAIELGDTLVGADAIIDKLIAGSWLDGRTRAIFVEFVLYNANLNMFAVSYVFFEFLPSGTILPLFRMHLMRLDNYTTAFQLALLGFQVLALLFIFFFMYKELKSIIRLKKKYFTGFWSILEFVILGLALAAVALFFCRLASLYSTRAKYLADKTIFVSFKDAADWDERYCLLLGIIVFLAFVKLLKLLRFNKRISMIGLTLQYMIRPLASFMVLLGIIFFAYVQMSYIIFGTRLLSFSTFGSASLNMITMILNKINYTELSEANQLFAPLVFFTFVIGVNFVLINFMVTIIMEGFAASCETLSKKKNQFEIVNFMLAKFKGVLGISSGVEMPPMRVTNGLIEQGSHEELLERLNEFDKKFSGYCDMECRGFMADVELEERNITKMNEPHTNKTIFSA